MGGGQVIKYLAQNKPAPLQSDALPLPPVYPAASSWWSPTHHPPQALPATRFARTDGPLLQSRPSYLLFVSLKTVRALLRSSLR